MAQKWALVSVFDKQGIVQFCQQVVQAGYGILSTGGTAKHLQQAGLSVTLVEDYTGFPEMMDGRVKTLHPRIHGGLLGLRDDAGHVASMQAHDISEIDLVVVNLYPFQQTIARPGCTFEEAVEMIDIGGPSMLRAAAKNYRFCMPVIDPSDYGWLGEALASGKTIGETERIGLAAKVFGAMHDYEGAIADYLQARVRQAGLTEGTSLNDACEEPIELFGHRYELKQTLRYGENPHQQAAFFADVQASDATLGGARQLQGKELSYNNIQDADAALNILRGLDDVKKAACVAVKHMNPCGVGLGLSAEQAFDRAYEADPVSIFGGILAFNQPVDGALAAKLTELFLEIVMAPAFTDEARAAFARKKNVRLLVVDTQKPLWQPGDRLLKRVSGGLLIQAMDLANTQDWQVVTRREPTPVEVEALQFAWRVVKYVKSNAIVVATAESTLGIGAGQMNRVGAAKIALEQAGNRAKHGVLASDAFFPMRDTVDAAAAAGIRAVVQPGGSIKDKESIEAADEHGIAMVFTGQRHFWH